MIAQKTQLLNARHLYFLASVAGLGILVSGLYLLGNTYTNRLFPNTYINNKDVSGKTLAEAIVFLESEKYELPEHQVEIYVDDISAASSSSELEYHINFQEAVNKTYELQHSNHPVVTAVDAILSYFSQTKVTAPTKYSEEKLTTLLSELNKNVLLDGKNPSISLAYSGAPASLVVNPGVPGREIAIQDTIELANKKVLLELQQKSDISKVLVAAQVASTSTVLNENEQETLKQRGLNFVGNKLTAKAEDLTFEISDKELIAILDPLGTYNQEKIKEILKIWKEEIQRDPTNAVFSYDKETLEVEEFTPHKNGLDLKIDTSLGQVVSWLTKFEELSQTTYDSDESITDTEEFLKHTSQPIELTLEISSPEIQLSETNDLGINERIGFGESYYNHSIPNRVHNVGITAERISYTIIPPGKEFSFNKTLGEVSSRTGFRSAYVIQGGKTVLGDGGGVCQVSSTLFRSVLDAGLDVSKRLQHSYRVSYYELNSDPGFDATVYSGDIDFRFINDTPGHVLLFANVDEENRYMNIEIYGTDDGRTAEIYDYKKWGFVGPPPPEYYPTDTLPSGVTEQVDWAVSGIKTEFKHTVRDADGNILHDDVYYSNYRPWSAKYMVGI